MAHRYPSSLPARAALVVLCTVFTLTLCAVLLLPQAARAGPEVSALAPFAVTAHQPVAHQVGVPLTATIDATFDDDVNTSTVTSGTFVVHGNLGGLATGTFGYDSGSRTGTLDPDRAFHAGEVLRVSATGGISSTGGAALTPYGWQFTAGPLLDRDFSSFDDAGAALTAVQDSSVASGDYDNDGDLDILLTGRHSGFNTLSRVYRNDGGVFTDTGAGLSGVYDGSAAWGDYDNDGDLDILLTGNSNGIIVSRLYRNDGASGFTNTGAALTGVWNSSVAWGDYDNDGDLDILLTGQVSGGGSVSKVYRNDGGGVFTDSGASLTAVSLSAVAWGDYDNDGDLDALVTGDSGGYTPSATLYRNDGGGSFSDSGAGLTGVYYGSVAWGDYDNDGDPDILITGSGPLGRTSTLFRNDTPSGFTDSGVVLTGVNASSVAWGDYDNDGDLDILLTGNEDATTARSIVYGNDGAGSFADTGEVLTGVAYGGAAWGDYDNDGDLDILLTGTDGITEVTKLYHNKDAPALGNVTPSSGSGPVGVTTYFTTTWSDPDGWQDLKQCYFHIGASPSVVGNVTLLYNRHKDKLWLLDDTGTGWLGGCHPGDMAVVSNSQADLLCGKTDVGGAGDTLGVRWAIEFKAGYSGVKKLGLKAKDMDKARAKGAWKGTWTIG
jgi:predicted nucleotidyltransferase